MNKQKYNLISSIISLTVTSFLLVFICLAWYVTNRESKASGANVNTASGGIYNISLTRYLAEKNDNETLTAEDDYYVKSTKLDDIEASQIPTFDMLGNYSKVIYEIQFKISDIDSVSLSLETNTEYNHTLASDGNGGFYNYLSNVATFEKLTEVDGKLSISENEKYCFEFIEDRENSVAIGEYEISSLVTSNGYYYIYLLFDYNVSNINTLFRYNLGTDAGSAETIYFKEDILLYIEGK